MAQENNMDIFTSTHQPICHQLSYNCHHITVAETVANINSHVDTVKVWWQQSDNDKQSQRRPQHNGISHNIAKTD